MGLVVTLGFAPLSAQKGGGGGGGGSTPPVVGGPTSGLVSLSIPAQGAGATVILASDPSLVAVPASVFLPQGVTVVSFPINTTTVPAATTVAVTATFDGLTVSTTLSLNPAPVVAVANVTVPAVVGGQSVIASVSMTNFPRNADGAVVTLTSSDPTVVQVPATVTVLQGTAGVGFTATTAIVKSRIKTVTITAAYNGTVVAGTVAVNPMPTVTISQADYLTDLQMLKVTAATSFENSILTYGTDVSGGPIGTMQFELGAFKGSILLATATGGGGTTSSSYKISISKTGKGAVTASPSAASHAAGTVVTLTATPDPGSPWIGWGGACSGTATTCTVTMNLSVTANFKSAGVQRQDWKGAWAVAHAPFFDRFLTSC